MFKHKNSHGGLSEFDENVLFLTRPYIKITLVCWFLSLYCILNTGNDLHSLPFVLSVFTFITDSILIVILYIKVKRIRRKTKEDA